jgi:hypothetical protein
LLSFTVYTFYLLDVDVLNFYGPVISIHLNLVCFLHFVLVIEFTLV